MEPDLRQIFADARKLRTAGFDTEKLNLWIGGQTNGQATNMGKLASLVGQQSEALTVAETPSKIPRPLRGVAAGLQQFGQGVTLGGGDELAGLIFGDEARDASREQQAQFQQEHPVLAPALQIAGGLATGAATGGVGSAAGRGALAIGEGALGGGLSAEGTLGERLPAAGLGALLGGGLAAATGLAGNVASRAAARLGGTTAARRGAVEAAQEIVARSDDFDISKLRRGLPGIRNARSAVNKETRLADLAPFEGTEEALDKLIQKNQSVEEIMNDIMLKPGSGVLQTLVLTVVQPLLAVARFAGGTVTRAAKNAQKRLAQKSLRELREALTSTDPAVQNRLLAELGQPPAGQLSPTTSRLAAGVAAPTGIVAGTEVEAGGAGPFASGLGELVPTPGSGVLFPGGPR